MYKYSRGKNNSNRNNNHPSDTQEWQGEKRIRAVDDVRPRFQASHLNLFLLPPSFLIQTLKLVVESNAFLGIAVPKDKTEHLEKGSNIEEQVGWLCQAEPDKSAKRPGHSKKRHRIAAKDAS